MEKEGKIMIKEVKSPVITKKEARKTWRKQKKRRKQK